MHSLMTYLHDTFKCQPKSLYTVNNIILPPSSTKNFEDNTNLIEVYHINNKSELHEIPLTFAVVAPVTPNKKKYHHTGLTFHTITNEVILATFGTKMPKWLEGQISLITLSNLSPTLVTSTLLGSDLSNHADFVSTLE